MYRAPGTSLATTFTTSGSTARVSRLFPFVFPFQIAVSFWRTGVCRDVSNVSTFSGKLRLTDLVGEIEARPFFFVYSSENMETLETPL
jgi:hypothetical protein